MKIPKKRIEEEFTEVDETGQEVKKRVERWIELETEDKAMLVPAKVGSKDYTIYYLNQACPRAFRKEIFNAMRKHFADFFDGRNADHDLDEFSKHSDEIYEAIEHAFLEENVDEEKMPLFDFDLPSLSDD